MIVEVFMSRKTISLRVDAINRNLQYADVHRWQIEHIREGVLQADKKEFSSEAEVSAAFSKRSK